MDKYLLTCIKCGTPFFTEGERQFYQSKKLLTPKRCKKCREEVKREVAARKRVLIEIEENWKDEAKQESSAYFYNIEEVEKIVTGKKHFIIGRKGSGKSAIANFLFESQQEKVFSEKMKFGL